MKGNIYTIAEGFGETDAVPQLLRRVFQQVYGVYDVDFPKTWRVSAGTLLKGNTLESYLLTASKKSLCRAVMVLLDADDEEQCPATLGPELLRRGQEVIPHIPLSVVLAKREYETWFIAGVKGLRGVKGLPGNILCPPNPEEIRGAKEWLSRHLPPKLPYAPTSLQASFTTYFDLGDAYDKSRSFRKMWKEMGRLASLWGATPLPRPLQAPQV